jgi:hypothetical protein
MFRDKKTRCDKYKLPVIFFAIFHFFGQIYFENLSERPTFFSYSSGKIFITI